MYAATDAQDDGEETELYAEEDRAGLYSSIALVTLSFETVK